MNTLGNLLWIVLGRFIIFLIYLFGSLILMITIVGIPLAFKHLKWLTWPYYLLEEKQFKLSARVDVYILL